MLRENTSRENTPHNCLVLNAFQNSAGLKEFPEPENTQPSSAEWFAMRDLKRPNAKIRAWQELTAAGFDVFTPLQQQIISRERRQVAVIPDLLFVHTTRAELDPIVARSTTLQYRYLKGAPAGTPVTVRAEEMNRFISLVRAAKKVSYITPDELTPAMIGRQVRLVCDGPLNGQIVNLLALPSSPRSRRILVTLPGLLSAALTLTPTALQPQ